MKEYRVEFWAEVGKKWLPVHECSHNRVFKSEDEARRTLSEHERIHPGMQFRIIERTITEWTEIN